VAECGHISLAVLRKDKSKLQDLLRKTPLWWGERNSFQQTPLHLAADWPEGVKLLSTSLQAEYVNLPDAQGLTALDYAIFWNSTESVKLLLNAGAVLYLEWFTVWPPYHLTQDMTDLLSLTLKSSRLELKQLALEKLPVAVSASLCLGQDIIPDSEAPQILALMKEHEYSISAQISALVPMNGTIYHNLGTVDNIREFSRALYHSGFNETDTAWYDITPIMGSVCFSNVHNYIFYYVEFLVGNGADILKEIPLCLISGHEKIENDMRKHLTIHKLGSNLGQNRELRKFYVLIVQPSHRVFWVQLFCERTTDPCKCSCSQNGCTFLSIYLKEHVKQCKRQYRRKPRLLLDTELVDFLGNYLLGIQKSTEDFAKLSNTIIRSITFGALDLTHTCCEFKSTWTFKDYPRPMLRVFPSEMAGDIRDEEKYTIEQLDNLVEEFTANFLKVKVPLKDFFERYWERRITEVLQDDVIDEDEKTQLRELGVRLIEVDESETSGSDYNDEDMDESAHYDEDETDEYATDDYDDETDEKADDMLGDDTLSI
jgi:Ankyrin repeats (3 copies)